MKKYFSTYESCLISPLFSCICSTSREDIGAFCLTENISILKSIARWRSYVETVQVCRHICHKVTAVLTGFLSCDENQNKTTTENCVSATQHREAHVPFSLCRMTRTIMHAMNMELNLLFCYKSSASSQGLSSPHKYPQRSLLESLVNQQVVKGKITDTLQFL